MGMTWNWTRDTMWWFSSKKSGRGLIGPKSSFELEKTVTWTKLGDTTWWFSFKKIDRSLIRPESGFRPTLVFGSKVRAERYGMTAERIQNVKSYIERKWSTNFEVFLSLLLESTWKVTLTKLLHFLFMTNGSFY